MEEVNDDECTPVGNFENWIDPVAEEILSEAPGIELVRLNQDDDEDKVFNVMKTAHGYQMLAKTEMLRKWWPDRAFIEKMPEPVGRRLVGRWV